MIHPDTSVRGSAHRSRVRGLAHSETRVYSITGEHLERLKNWNNELRIWDAQTGEHLGTHLSSRLTRYTSIALSADESKLLITATDSNQVTLWHVDSLR
jgi:WD40 repeat protein